MLDFNNDLPAVIGNRSGAGCARYDLARVLCAERKSYDSRSDMDGAGKEARQSTYP